MKKLIFFSLFLTANTFVFAQAIRPRPPTPDSYKPRPLTPDEIRFNEEQLRIQTEKRYYDGVLDGTLRRLAMATGESLHTMTLNHFFSVADTNSIPILIELNQELMDKNKDEDQKELYGILQILLCIESPMALDTIFNMLDLADEKYGEKTALIFYNQQPTGKTLRELLLADIFEPCARKDNTPKWKIVVEGETWQEMFKNYQSDKLSEKNQTFLTNVRQRIQVKEEAKKEEDEK